MPELLVLGLIILVIYVIYKLTRKSTGTGTSSTPSPQPPYRPVETKRDPNVYRPSTGRRPSPSRIKFNDPGQNTDTHELKSLRIPETMTLVSRTIIIACGSFEQLESQIQFENSSICPILI